MKVSPPSVLAAVGGRAGAPDCSPHLPPTDLVVPAAAPRRAVCKATACARASNVPLRLDVREPTCNSSNLSAVRQRVRSASLPCSVQVALPPCLSATACNAA